MTEQNSAPQQTMPKTNPLVFIIGGAVIVAILLLGWLFANNKPATNQPNVSPPTTTTTEPPTTTAPQGLGGEIAEQIQNPLGNSLPDTTSAAGTVNPLEGAYQNPFGQ